MARLAKQRGAMGDNYVTVDKSYSQKIDDKVLGQPRKTSVEQPIKRTKSLMDVNAISKVLFEDDEDESDDLDDELEGYTNYLL